MEVTVYTTQTNYAACKARARQLVHERLRVYQEQYPFTFQRVSIKNLRTRWGSCSSKGNLNFHYRLLFLPLPLVDYVIVHELCHLGEMNHSGKFWRLVEQTIPDARQRMNALRLWEKTHRRAS